MAIGRPREFSNAAEKQKAYRERKKQESQALEALRKYEWETSVAGLVEKVDLLEEVFNSVQREFPTRDADLVPDWSKRVTIALDNWWVAHSAWYKAWKAAGFPKDCQPASSFR